MRRFPLGLIVVLVLASVGAARGADFATYLQTIGLDDIRADDSPYKDFLGEGMGIAIFDTGVDAELAANDHTAFDDSGETRVRGGANFASDDPTGRVYGDIHSNGHGTRVASMAAGRHVTLDSSPDFDVSGIAPKADIYSVRVLNESGGGSFSGIISGLDWVIEQVQNHDSNIRVVNMSLGTTSTFVTEPAGSIVNQFNERVADLEAMGIPVFAASGNSGDQNGLSFPAIADGVISVGSTTSDGSAVSSFTNRNNLLDLLAPGQEIYGAAVNQPNTYVQGNGTSFAAPLASGAALILAEAYEQTFGVAPTVAQIQEFLTASPFQLTESETSFPLLDLESALAAATTIPEPISIVILTPAALLLIARRPADRRRAAA